MTGRELRIDNIVKDGIVRAITHRHVTVYNTKTKSTDDRLAWLIEPELLTEEWFDRTKDDWTLDEASDEHYEFNVDGVQWCQILKKELQYVHQLQNLYFALTG